MPNINILSPSQTQLQHLIRSAREHDLYLVDIHFALDGLFPPQKRERGAPKKREEIENNCLSRGIVPFSKLDLDFWPPTTWHFSGEYPDDFLPSNDKYIKRLLEKRVFHLLEAYPKTTVQKDYEKALKVLKRPFLDTLLDIGYQIHKGEIAYKTQNEIADIFFNQKRIYVNKPVGGDLYQWLKEVKNHE